MWLRQMLFASAYDKCVIFLDDFNHKLLKVLFQQILNPYYCERSRSISSNNGAKVFS